MNAWARGGGAERGARSASLRDVSATRAAPDNLIHRNKVPNPALARVTARFDFPEGVPIGVLFQALELPFPVAVEVLRRATR